MSQLNCYVHKVEVPLKFMQDKVWEFWGCVVGKRSFRPIMLTWMLLPSVFFLVLEAMHVGGRRVATMWNDRNDRNDRRSDQAVASAAVRRAASDAVGRRSLRRHGTAPQESNAWPQRLVLTAVLFYAPVNTTIFHGWRCDDGEGQFDEVLMSDYITLCNDPVVWWCSRIMACLWTVGIPATLAVLLLRLWNRGELRTEETNSKWGFMYRSARSVAR